MINRNLAIENILKHVGPNDMLLSTTGMISREVFVTADRPGNFYMLGSMGLLSSFGLGLALMVPEQRVIILEGDGSAMMSLGNLPLIASAGPLNLIHVILDNEAYESTGGQPSISSGFDLARIGLDSGYSRSVRVDEIEELEPELLRCTGKPGTHLLVIKCSIAPISGIPRVSHTPTEIRDRFKAHIRSKI